MFKDFPSLHPFAVHFPIVLILLAVAFQAIVVLKPNWQQIRWASLSIIAVGFLSAWATSTIFHAEPMPGTPKDAMAMFESHEKYAQYTLWTSGLTLLLKGIGDFYKIFKRSYNMLVLVVAIAAAIFLSIAGHHGARLTHIAGVGPMGRYLMKEHGMGGHDEMKGMDEMKEMPGNDSMTDKKNMNGTDDMKDMKGMDKKEMKGMDNMKDMKSMDKKDMKGMDKKDMKGMDNKDMKGMDNMKDIKGMDNKDMKGMDNMKDMKGMDKKDMKGMDNMKDMKGTDKKDMQGMDNMKDMKGMDNMKGMKGMKLIDNSKPVDNNPAIKKEN
jgi:uncharacterized membrane protein